MKDISLAYSDQEEPDGVAYDNPTREDHFYGNDASQVYCAGDVGYGASQDYYVEEDIRDGVSDVYYAEKDVGNGAPTSRSNKSIWCLYQVDLYRYPTH